MSNREAIRLQKLQIEGFNRHQQEQKDEAVRAAKEKHDANVLGIRALASKFVTWVGANQIPFDFNTLRTVDTRSLWQKLIGAEEEAVTYGVAGWILATRDFSKPTFGDGLAESTANLCINPTGDLAVSFSDSYDDGQSLFRREATDDGLSLFTVFGVQHRIAALCVEHEVEWGIPD